MAIMTFEFSGKIFQWRRAPSSSPFRRSTAAMYEVIANLVTYGWGVIPVQVRIGETDEELRYFPKTACTWCPSKRPSKGRKTWLKATK